MSEELSKVEENTPEEKPKRVKKPKSKVRVILEWTFTGLFALLFVFFAIGQVTGMVNRNKNYGNTLTYGYGTFYIASASMEPEYPVGTAIITHKDDPESIVKDFKAGKIVDITMYSAYLSNGQKYDYNDYRPDDIDVYYYGRTVVYGEKLPGKEPTQEFHYSLSGHSPVYPTGSTTRVVTHRLIGVYVDESREKGTGKYTFVIAGINTEGDLSKEGQYQLLTENELLGVVKVNSPFLGKFFGFITSPWGLLVFLLIPAFYLVITSVLDIFKAMKEPDDKDDNSSNHSSGGGIDGLSEKDKERLKKEMLEQMLSKKGGGK